MCKPDTDLDAELTDGVPDRSRTLHGPGRTVEDREHSVASPLDQMPAEARQLSIDRPVVLFESGSSKPGHRVPCACSVEPTMSEKRTVARRRSLGAICRVPVRNSSISPANVCIARPTGLVGRVELHVAGTGDVAAR